MKQLAIMNLVASLACMVMLIVVGAKLQVAKEDAAKALKDFTSAPLNTLMGFFKKGSA